MLEKRVAERTEDLTRLNDALERATAAAEEANISKTRFLAAAGHDILQPLNAARLYATALSERTAGSGEAGLADNLGTALDGVEDILRAVLDISRLDAASLKPDSRPFRLQEVFDRIRVDFAEQARSKGLTLTIIPCSLAVHSDPQLLGRLLQNLVSNAIKYTPRGRVLVGCRRKRNRVAIEVVDTGIGIAPDEKAVIFKEFRRLDAGARVAPGLGLGLSIVERVAKLLGIGITLDSAPGRGTRVSLSVPLAAAAPVAAQPAHPPAAPSAVSGLTVLCIDNDEKILAGMTALLSGWGCTPIVAHNAREAVRQLRGSERTPELMLVDYHLDEGDGLSAIADVRWKLERRHPGHPGHRRPLGGAARARAEGGHPRAQQAGEAGGAQGADGAMERAPTRGGVITPPGAPSTGRARIGRPPAPPWCGSPRRASAARRRRAPSPSPRRR